MASIQKQIEEKINKMDSGSMFSINDFVVYGKYDTVKKVLIRLEDAKYIFRIIDGIYMKPKYSKLTKELIPPSMNDIAGHIAEKNGWSIVPTGDTCLNYLGLSTQMPARYEYISDGPYRKYEVFGFLINFKHTTNKEVKNLSYKSAVVVQAIKAMGKENIDEKVLLKIKECLSEEEQEKLMKECRKVTAWVFEFIRELVGVQNVKVSES